MSARVSGLEGGEGAVVPHGLHQATAVQKLRLAHVCNQRLTNRAFQAHAAEGENFPKRGTCASRSGVFGNFKFDNEKAQTHTCCEEARSSLKARRYASFTAFMVALPLTVRRASCAATGRGRREELEGRHQLCYPLSSGSLPVVVRQSCRLPECWGPFFQLFYLRNTP